ncbi:MAG: hypothetical protein AAB653_00205, partial [Patescibacteria group bacterium]
PGMIIGTALESLSEADFENFENENLLKIVNCELKIGRVMVFVNPHWNIGSLSNNGSLTAIVDNGEKVEIINPTEISAVSDKTALIINQSGQGDVADFQTNGVSVVNIDSSGQVKIIGSMLVDGRIMLCTGGFCSDELNSNVDETQADLGVEGKVVANAFEGYCDKGFVWARGSAKYGTLPGFCVMSDLAKKDANNQLAVTNQKDSVTWASVSQGQAQMTCQTLGVDYHLISENEWLTIAENILKVKENDIDQSAAGMQLATTSSATSSSYKLTNNNIINNLTGVVAEWTNKNVTFAGLPTTPTRDQWLEYSDVEDFKGLDFAPDYYLTDQNNNIGKIYIGSAFGLKGFVRGFGGIYGLDLSHAPDEQSVDIGFRCAK